MINWLSQFTCLAAQANNFIDLKDLPSLAAHIAVIVILALFFNSLARRLLKRIANRMRERGGPEMGPRAATLVETSISLARYIIFFFAAFMILTEAGFDPLPLVAGAGVIGLAIGFGAQSLVKDVVSGFFILLESQYAIGDFVEINGTLGTVEEVGLRLTKLRDIRSQLHFFPNGAITTVNRFPAPGVKYLLHIPIDQATEAAAASLTEQTLADFDREYQAFTTPPARLGTKELSTYTTVLTYQVSLLPFRQAVTLDKLPARLTGALKRASLAPPEGTEVSLLPALPQLA